MRRKHARALWLAPLAVAGGLSMLLFGACGGGDGDDDEDQVTATSASAVATATTTGASGGDSVEVNQSFWHAGWKVDLGTATLASNTVTIDAVFENLSDSTSSFNSQLALTSGSNSYATEGLEQDLPSVPGGLTGNGTIAIDVDENFTFDDATLIVGNPSNNQAIVPLGPGGDTLVSLEPQAVTVSGAVTAGALTVDVQSGELRADLPDLSDEVVAGKLVLTINFTATPHAGIQVGQGVLTSENFALTLPDGTSVSVRSDGVSGVNEILQGREETTISGLNVRFEVPAPASGNYAFIVRGNYGPGGAQAEGSLPFTIP